MRQATLEGGIAQTALLAASILATTEHADSQTVLDPGAYNGEGLEGDSGEGLGGTGVPPQLLAMFPVKVVAADPEEETECQAASRVGGTGWSGAG